MLFFQEAEGCETKGLKLSAIILLLAGVAFGQQWTMTLTSGQEYPYVMLKRLEGDTLYFDVSNAEALLVQSSTVLLTQIEEIRFRSSKHRGFLYTRAMGCAVGCVGGALVSVALISFVDTYLGGDFAQGFLYLLPTGPLVGGIIGGVVGGRVQVMGTYDLSQRTTEEKVKTIQQILAKQKK